MLSQWTLSFLLVKSLEETINNYFLESNLILDFDFDSVTIELNYSKPVITYQTLICLFLSRKYQINLNNLAKYLVYIYHKNCAEITINISNNNWLELQPSDRLLTNCLSKLLLINWQDFPECKNNFNKHNLGFNDYYIFARFASILTSAYQDNLISFSNLNFYFNKIDVKLIEQILGNQFFLVGSYEYNLIKDLLFITEKIYQSQSKINYGKLLIKLRDSMVNFERYCRIWGEVKEENLSLSQARLCLMAIALNYYQNLFYRQFGEKLPLEL